MFLGKYSFNQFTCLPKKQNLTPYCEGFDLFAIVYHCFCVPKYKEASIMMNLVKWLSLRKTHLFSSAYKELCYESESLFHVPKKEVTQSDQIGIRILFKCNQKITKGHTSSEILHHVYRMMEYNFWSVIFFATWKWKMEIVLGLYSSSGYETSFVTWKILQVLFVSVCSSLKKL